MNHSLDEHQRFERTLHVGGPNIGDRQVFDRLVDQIFQRHWFTNGGEVVRDFEAMLCDYLGVKHCITVCNATIGLQLACHALELTGEIIVPAFTFVATPHAIQWKGLTPVFADVDPKTHTISAESAGLLINERTSALVGVHLWGNPCDTAELSELASQHNLRIIYDAAQAFGCSHGTRMIGNFGDCEVFSFHATKFFNTFEGGAIATNDDNLAQKIEAMKNFGFAGMDRVVHLGTNAKMTEICAAMGISMFARIDELFAANQRNYERYQRWLGHVPGLKIYSFDHLAQANWQYIVVEVQERLCGAARDDVMRHLQQNSVRARRYYYPGCHKMEPYRSKLAGQEPNVPNTDSLCSKVLCLPTGSVVEIGDVDRVCDLILEMAGSNHQMQRRAAG